MDWDYMLEIAVKSGIDSHRFWKMSLKEVFLEMEGYNFRFDKEAHLLAHLTAVVANPHYKKNLKAKDLYNLGRMDEVVDIAERKKRFKKAVDLMGPQAIPIKRRSS